MNTRFGVPAGLVLVILGGVFAAIVALGIISPLGVQGADHPIDDNGQAVDFQPQMVMDFMVDNTVKHPGAVSGFRISFTTAAYLVAHQDTISVHFDKDFKGHGTGLSRNHVAVYAAHASDATIGDTANILQTGAYSPSADPILDRLETAHPVHHGQAVPRSLTNSDVLNNIEHLIPVPDMNGANDGAPGIAAGSTVTVFISAAAGIRNPTEAGKKGPIGVYTSRQPYLVYGPFIPAPVIALSDHDANRGKVLTVIGRGFKNGATATIYLDNANGNLQALASAPVASDDTFEAQFTVTVPPFVPGKGNIIHAEDGNEPPQVSNRLEFKLEGLLTVSPTEAEVGDEVDITLEDWPNGPIPAGAVTIAGVTQSIIGSPRISGNSANFRIEIGTGTPSGTKEIKVTANGESDVQKITITDTFSPGPGSVAGDRAALVVLYNATDGANWTNNSGWLTEAPLSQWHGVEADDIGRVTGLHLSFNRLTGEMPAELGNLTNLNWMSLSHNQLSGQIPAELGSLTNLHTLELYGNELIGQIPSELGSVPSLLILDLSENRLSGQIPGMLANLSNLEILGLGNNHLGGEIPIEFGSLFALQELDLGANQLSGEIPGELGNLTNLRRLYLLNNHLSGEIPEELGGLSNLQVLYLNNNQLMGEIPARFGRLANLTYTDLSANRLSGRIPSEFGGLLNLTFLDLRSNQLRGEIPWELGALSNLRWLSLSYNQLSGEIPPSLGSLSGLQRLHLRGNRLSGDIPAELGNLSNLQSLWLQGNQLSGQIPVEITGLSNLEYLELADNRLSGNIPAELGNLMSLEALYLASNQLTGCIPASLRSIEGNDLAELGLLFCDMLDGRPVVVLRFVTEAGAAVRLGSPVSLEATLSEPVTGFTLEDVRVANGVASTFAGNGSVYAFDVTPNAIGEVTVDIAADVAEDADGNGNIEALLSLGIPYDDDGNGAISKSELISAINDYLFGDGSLEKSHVIALINLYLFGGAP